MYTLKIKTSRRTQMVNVTAEGQQAVEKSRVASGVCYVYVPHTTAAITINECADPDGVRDVESAFDRLIPEHGAYKRSEGNSASHMKTALVGTRQIIFVEDGKLVLGR